jgi:hypothetical protein
MTDSANPRFRAVVQTVGVIATLIWTIAFLSLFVGHSGPNTPLIWAGIQIALFGAPLFFFSVLPALIYSQWGGPSGPKIGAALLLGGLALVVIGFAVAMLR